jgi:hypothetical protein
MKSRIERRTVDLSAYPDLVVNYLGLRVNSLKGMRTAGRLGSAIKKAVAAEPDGMLLHEGFLFSLFPPQLGIRQYWRDFESLESWARSLPHQQWWQDFMRDPGGTGFWHEIYFMRGGMEAIYDDMEVPMGFAQFARTREARGALISARKRLGLKGDASVSAPVREEEIYRNDSTGWKAS